MSTDFSFVLVRYAQDPLTGERLNVGVVAYDPRTGDLRWKFAKNRTRRLSEAFRGFDATAHRLVINDLESSLFFVRGDSRSGQYLLIDSPFKDSHAIMSRLWPDKGGRYTFSEPKFDSAERLGDVLDELFERYVSSQMPVRSEDDERDDQVWKQVEGPLRERVQLHRITRSKVETPEGPVVARTFTNGKRSIIQPLSFDLADATSITRKAHLWFGRAYSFSHTADLEQTIYLVAGPETPARAKAYDLAIGLLSRAAMQFSKFSLFRIEEQTSFIQKVGSLVGFRE